MGGSFALSALIPGWIWESARAPTPPQRPGRKKQHVLWAHEIYINIFTTHRSLMDYSCDSNLLFIDWLPSRLAAVKINKMKYGELGCGTRAKNRHTQQYKTHRAPVYTLIKLNQQTHSTAAHTDNKAGNWFSRQERTGWNWIATIQLYCNCR